MIVQTLTQLVTPHVQALWIQFAQYGLEGRQTVIVKFLIAAIRRSVAVRPEALQIIAEGEAIPQFLLALRRHIARFFQQILSEGRETWRLTIIIYIGLQFNGITVTQSVVVGEWSLAVLLVARTFVVHLDDEYWRLA